MTWQHFVLEVPFWDSDRSCDCRGRCVSSTILLHSQSNIGKVRSCQPARKGNSALSSVFGVVLEVASVPDMQNRICQELEGEAEHACAGKAKASRDPLGLQSFCDQFVECKAPQWKMRLDFLFSHDINEQVASCRCVASLANELDKC